MFLPYEHQVVHASTLAGIVASDVAIATEEDVILKCLGNWWVIACLFDWLENTESRDHFTELVPFPKAGVNTIHSEILLTAYAHAVVTVHKSELRTVSGSLEEKSCLWEWCKANCNYGRIVAFRM